MVAGITGDHIEVSPPFGDLAADLQQWEQFTEGEYVREESLDRVREGHHAVGDRNRHKCNLEIAASSLL